MYGGRVPLGSVFSYLQRLSMTWRGSVAIVPCSPVTRFMI